MCKECRKHDRTRRECSVQVFNSFTNANLKNTIDLTIKGEFSCVTNSLSNDKFLDCSKFKAFADDKISVTHKFKFD